METVLITGGTGLIGNSLASLLVKKGFNVTFLSRQKTEKSNYFYWNIENGYIDVEAIKSANYIVHLAGSSIAQGRWTAKRKKEILESRTQSTQLLYDKVKELNPNLKAFIAASGVGFYGAVTSEITFTESNSEGNDFLSSVCVKWESKSKQFEYLGIRTVILRTGVVFAKKNSALQKISKPIKMGFGAVIGKGTQFIPWIHINDICKMYYYAIENNAISGVFNATSPFQINNYELTHLIANNYKKTIWLPNVPEFIFKIIFGEMGNLITKGSAISVEKILGRGFKFKYANINLALENLLEK